MGFFDAIKAITSSQYRNYYTALMDFRRSCKYRADLTEDLAKRVIKHFYPNEEINATFFKQALDNANTSSAKNNVSIAPKKVIDAETCKILLGQAGEKAPATVAATAPSAAEPVAQPSPAPTTVAKPAPTTKPNYTEKYRQVLNDFRKSYYDCYHQDIGKIPFDMATRAINYYYPNEEISEEDLNTAITYSNVTSIYMLKTPQKKLDKHICLAIKDPNYDPKKGVLVDKYYQALFDLRKSFFSSYDEYKFSYDAAARVVNHFYPNEEISEEVLLKAIEKINAKSYLTENAIVELDEETCMKLLCPNYEKLEEIAVKGVDTVLESLGKYRDYSLGGEFDKVFEANGIDQDVIDTDEVLPKIFSELEKRLRNFDKVIASRLTDPGKTTLYVRGKQDERTSMLWGTAYRISRLVKTPIAQHTPISKDEWYELFKTIPSVAKDLDGLSPEGFERELDSWICLNFDPLGPVEGEYEDLSFKSFAKGNSLAFDMSLYMAYCELYKDKDDQDFSLDHILDVLLDKADGIIH